MFRSSVFSFPHESTKYHGKAKQHRPPHWVRMLSKCLTDIPLHMNKYEAAIQDTSWIMRASEKPCLLSLLDDVHIPSQLPQIRCNSIPERYCRTKDMQSYTKNWQKPNHNFEENQKQPFHFLFGFCSCWNHPSNFWRLTYRQAEAAGQLCSTKLK